MASGGTRRMTCQQYISVNAADGKIRKQRNIPRAPMTAPPPAVPKPTLPLAAVNPPPRPATVHLQLSHGGCHLGPAGVSSRKSSDRSASSAVVSSPYGPAVDAAGVAVIRPDGPPRNWRLVGCVEPEDATTTHWPPGSISNAVIGLVGVNSEMSCPVGKCKHKIF